MRKLVTGGLLVSLLTASQMASAGLILQDRENGFLQVNHFEPLGQSFTAEDSFVSFAFWYEAINSTFPVSDLTLSLISGDGLGGAVLTSSTFSLAPSYVGYLDVDLASIELTAGQRYTAALSAVGDSPFWGIRYSTGFLGDSYAGGQLHASQPVSGGDTSGFDARFRVTPGTPPTSVPEPGALALFGAGLLGIALLRRNRGKSIAS